QHRLYIYMLAVKCQVTYLYRFDIFHILSSDYLSLKQLDYIADSYNNNQKQQSSHADKMNHSLVLGLDRLSPYSLYYQEYCPRSIKSGYWQKIEYAYIYSYEYHE